MNKPSVAPPKGWRWFEVGERVRVGDGLAFVKNGKAVISSGSPFTEASCAIGAAENGSMSNIWHVRRLPRKPKRSLAATLKDADERFLSYRSENRSCYFDALARAARRHIRQEGGK